VTSDRFAHGACGCELAGITLVEEQQKSVYNSP
jgi:hypothetical protein